MTTQPATRRSRPLDPRLLAVAGSARSWVLLAAALQVLTAGLLVVQAFVLARALAGVVDAATAGLAIPVASVRHDALLLAGVFAVRAVVAGVAERFGQRAATSTIAQLRTAVLRHVADAGPAALDPDRGIALSVLVTRGLTALDAYLVRYLPQLVATAVITPGLLAVVFTRDVLAGVIMVLTLPLVPLLMALVGWTTQSLSQRRTAQLQRLGAQVLDLIAGLPTLRALGRANRQAERVRAVGDAYRHATNRVLQRAFLSGLVLELFTTLSVAVVAVAIGLRLVNGSLDLETGLAVLVLAPEVFLPLRMVGLHFHASADGVAAASQALAVLDEPVRRRPGSLRPDAPVLGVAWDDMSLDRPERGVTAPAGLTGRATARTMTAVVGENGSGKSTAIAILLGLREPSRGRVLVEFGAGAVRTQTGVLDLAELDRAWWQRQCAWVPQRGLVVPGSLVDNVTLGAPDISAEELDQVAALTGLDAVVAEHPDGWGLPLANTGVGVSAGQRQRIALARALLAVRRGARVVIADEPTAHLDADVEALVVATLSRLRDDGYIVIVVAHREELVTAADAVVAVTAAALSPPTSPAAAGPPTEGAP